MKNIFLFFALFCLSIAAIAADFEVDDIAYNIIGDSTNRQVEVAYKQQYWYSVEIPDSVMYQNNKYAVTGIGANAFYRCKFSSITLPKTILYIGKWAFYECVNLSTIDIPESVDSIGPSAFYECSSLTTIMIPSGVKSIGSSAFLRCFELTSIDLPKSLIYIGSGAFADCNKLSTLTIPNNIRYIPSSLCNGCDSLVSITFSDSITAIGENAFYTCGNLLSISIPNSVISIGDNAFYNCRKLSTVFIPKTVETIGRYAFTNVTHVVYEGDAYWSPWGAKCLNGYVEDYFVYKNSEKKELKGCFLSAVGEINIPSTVKSIGKRAFASCEGITSITIPNTVTWIGDGAFASCSNLSSVQYSDSMTWIGYEMFCGCEKLTSFNIPNSVTRIGELAFYKCSFTTVYIPESVSKIEGYAFYQCDKITKFTVDSKNTSYCSKDGVLYDKSMNYIILYPVGNTRSSFTIPYPVIGTATYAFYGCKSLTSVTLPCSMSKIAYDTFNGCSNMVSITCEATTPPKCYTDCFTGISRKFTTVYVPSGSVDVYKAANEWKDFKTIKPITADSAEMESQKVVVEATNSQVTLTWPKQEETSCYELVIMQNTDSLCAVKFDSIGQLLSKNYFSPSRGTNHYASQAEDVISGYKYTIAGLESNTNYAYSIEAKDTQGKQVAQYVGDFSTKSTPTDIVEIGNEKQDLSENKIIDKGRILIKKGEKMYDILGREVVVQ